MTSGPEPPPGGAGRPADHREAVVTPVETGDRLEGAHVTREIGDRIGRDVGQHGHHHVHRPPPRRRHPVEEISLLHGDAISPRARGRHRVVLGTEHRRPRFAGMEGAAPGPEVNGPAMLGKHRRGALRQRLALPPWHVHTGIDTDRAPAECRRPGNPCQWLAGRPPLDQ